MLKCYHEKFLLAVLAFILIITTRVMAQQLPQINYQGVARKADGSPVADQTIRLRLTIHDGGSGGPEVYSETRQLSTNKFGLFTTVIGSAGAISQNGTLAGVTWSTGNKFLQVEIDPAGGNNFADLGTSQLQSVPYAIYATAAAPAGSAGGDLSGAYPNPTVNKIRGANVSDVPPNVGQVLKWDGSSWIPSNEEGAVGMLNASLPLTVVTSGRNSTLSIDKADANTSGYLSKTDWIIFNGKATTTYVDEAISTAMAAEAARAAAAENTLTTTLTAEVSRATTAEATKEALASKSTDVTADAASDTKYPSVKAVKTYVDAASAAGTTALAGEVTRATAAESLLANNLAAETTRATTAEGTKEILANKSTDITADAASDTKYPSVKSVKNYVDASITATSIPDANSTIKGKIQLAGDLGGTAAAPVIADGKIGTAKIADGAVTDAKIASGISASKVGLGNVNNTSDADKPVSDDTQAALDLKANLASPTFTGTVSGITAAMVGLGNVSNTSDADKPVSTATQTALNAKEAVANKSTDIATDAASDTKYPSVKSVKTYVDASITATSIPDANSTTKGKIQLAGDLDGTAAAPVIADGKISTAKIADGAVTDAKIASGISASKVGLGNVNNTSDADKPVSDDTQAALDLKANLASPTFTGTVSGITAAMVGLGNVNNTSDADKPVSDDTQAALDLKANLASPTFTGTVGGITAAMVGLGNVNNTSDADKPVSDDTQAALDLKANLASPTFTGTVSGITAAMVGLGNVSNTSDADKPVSDDTQAALDLKANLASPSFTGAPLAPTATAGTSTTQIATTAFVTGAIATATPDASASATGKIQLAGDLTGTAASPAIAAGAINNSKISATAAIADTKLATISTAGKIANSATTATSANTSGAIVARDGSGNFSAGTITANITGNVSGTAATVTTAAQPAITSVGTLTSLTSNGAITGASFVKTGGTASEFLKADGSVDANTYLTASSAVTSLDGLSDAKVAGTNFTNSLLLGHQTTGTLDNADRNIGVGLGALAALTTGDDNIAIGFQALTANTTGQQNLAIGRASMAGNETGGSNTAVGLETLESNSTGHHNSAFGHLTMVSNSTGSQNAAYGQQALADNDTGDKNTAMGAESLAGNTTGHFNVAVGFGSGGSNGTGSNNTMIGYNSNVSVDGLTNATALGNGAVVDASNKIQLGNTSVTLVNTSGAITSAGAVTGASIVKTGGTAAQILMADGSVLTAGTNITISSGTISAVVREVADEFSATASQTSFTLTQTPSANSKVKMFVNGVRISNLAYNHTGTALTYVPASNGGYSLSAGDRIQFDYYY